MLRSRQLIINNVDIGTLFTLEGPGDELPIHVHTVETENHFTIVTFGAVRLLGIHEGRILRADPLNTVIRWKLNEPHGFAYHDGPAGFANILTRFYT